MTKSFFFLKIFKIQHFYYQVESSQVLNFLLPTLFMARWLYSLCMRSVHDCWLPIVDIDKSAPLIYAPSYSSLFNSRACGGTATLFQSVYTHSMHLSILHIHSPHLYSYLWLKSALQCVQTPSVQILELQRCEPETGRLRTPSSKSTGISSPHYAIETAISLLVWGIHSPIGIGNQEVSPGDTYALNMLVSWRTSHDY